MSNTAPPPPFAAQPAPQPPAYQPPTSNKSFVVTWLLSYFLGILGVDRFYLGKVGTGIIKLLTIGGFGVWWLIDLIIVLAGGQRDKQGQPLAGYAEHKKLAWIVTAGLIVLSIIVSSVSGALGGSTGAQDQSSITSADDSTDQSDAAAEDEPAAETDEVEPEPEPEPAEPTAPEWADSSYGTFDPVSASGSGDDIVALPEGATAGIATASYTGSGNFAISVIDANNESTGELLVNTIGAYSGTTVYGINALGDGVNLKITASGPWELTLSPVSAAPALPESGSGDGVYLYDGDAASATIDYTGDSNFAVLEETGESLSFGLLVNEIGAYSGTVPVSAGPSVISITSSGDWTISIG